MYTSHLLACCQGQGYLQCDDQNLLNYEDPKFELSLLT